MPELSKTILANNTNIKSYLDFNGADGATTFTDTTGKTWTAVATAQLDTAQQKFGTASLLLDGNSDYLTTPHTADLCTPGTGDFSIAFWVRFTTVTSVDHGFCGIRVDGSNTFRFRWDGLTGTTNRIKFIWADAATVRASYEIAWTPSADTWYHIAVTRSGTLFSCYANGTSLTLTNVITAISTNSLNDINSTFNIGVDVSGTAAYLNGWMDDFVFLKGTALSADQIKELYEGRYVGEGWAQSGLVAGYHLNGNSTDFSGNNNHGTDTAVTYSLANGKFNKGGGFDGISTTGSRIATTITPPTTSFTLSCWVNYASFTDQGSIVGFSDNAATRYISLLRAGSGSTSMRFSLDATTTKVDHPAVLSLNTWYHVVGVYDDPNNLIYIYVNGNGVSGAASVTLNSTGTMAIGSIGAYVSSAMLNGKADEVHYYSVAKDARWVRQQFAWGSGKFL